MKGATSVFREEYIPAPVSPSSSCDPVVYVLMHSVAGIVYSAWVFYIVQVHLVFRLVVV